MKKKLVLVATISLLAFLLSADAREISRAEFIEQMNVLFFKEDYRGLINDAKKNLSRQRLSGKEKKEVLYLTGLSYMKLKDFSAAREAFNSILDMRRNEYKEDAYISMADSYFQEGNYDKAIRIYEKTLYKYPGSDRLSGVYYNLGLSYKAKKDLEKANYCFRKLKTRYKTSFEADKAVYLTTGKKAPTYYIIQLGAFKSLKNAKKLVRRLSRKKYDSYIQKIKKGRSVLYRVRGGKFSNKNYAMRLYRRLRRSGFAVKVIVE